MYNRPPKRARSPSPYFPSLPSKDDRDQEDQDRPSIRNLQALEAELCQRDRLGVQCESRCDEIEGGRLIKLNTDYHHLQQQEEEAQEQKTLPEQNSIWVDRYDARLLLSPPSSHSTLSNLQPQITSPPPLSPTGYSDLPSDHEEMFYFEPEERHEIAQKKLRRKRDDERSVRIKLREEEDRIREEQLRLSKIPPTEQVTLMKRTLEALKTSPSPSLLEIRILANHGNDPRFSSFLRREGKWRDYWESIKSAPDLSSSSTTPSNQPVQKRSSSSVIPSATVATCGLVDYGDSSDEDESVDRRSSVKDQEESQTVSKDGLNIIHEDKDEQTAERIDTTNAVDNLLESDSTITIMNTDKVDPIERSNRQQRAKLWAEKRKKSNPVIIHPSPPTTSS
ncbi:hypothetical protein PSTG_06246 [Puccinia striiformis f. sp. tritici PST-78]|uniref:SURP motif domain-containing protein n=1 Tax=Puccinia striiformis f. sp. tritici PST-78 TaxID=1165861 RepID=A0A0L0VMP5_9BASI|nr:hypothetical protein PSTG_06246 [Puccinia striiformis f. sp. tritici PST-78]